MDVNLDKLTFVEVEKRIGPNPTVAKLGTIAVGSIRWNSSASADGGRQYIATTSLPGFKTKTKSVFTHEDGKELVRIWVKAWFDKLGDIS